jgi:hypothetical protein
MLEKGIRDHRHERVAVKTLPRPALEHRRQKFVLVAKVIFAKLPCDIPHGLQHGGDCDRLRGNSNGSAGLTDRRHTGPDRQFAGDEVRTSGGAARLIPFP